MNITINILRIIFLSLIFLSIRIENLCAENPLFSSYSFEIGETTVYDTYLSPLKYSGTSYNLSGTWQKSFTNKPNLWSMHFDADISYAGMTNPASTASMLQLDAFFEWGADIRKKFNPGITLSAGLSSVFNTGVLYVARNSNNPANAKASAAIAINGSAYYVFKLGKLPIRVTEHLSLPSIGCFFSPGFAEPYYEIYLGNHSNLTHTYWWGNHLTINNLIAFDLDFGRTALRLGYNFSFMNSHANHNSSGQLKNAFVIGVIPGGLGLKKTNKNIINNTFTPFN